MSPGDGVLDELVSKLGDLLGLGVTLTADQQNALMPYGGYQLQWGDSDTLDPPIYEGLGRVPPETLPDPGADGYVTVLQKQLQQLGFMPALPVDGTFDRYTSWQVREFQIYAGMDNVATEDPNAPGSYADRLSATPNAQKYSGDITGRLDGATALALQYWVASSYRCPVVAQSLDQALNLIVDNIWFTSEDPQTGHMCWVTDLSGSYAVDPRRMAVQGGGDDLNNRKVLAGYYVTVGAGGGPVCQEATGGHIGTLWADANPAAADAIPQWTNITIQTLTGDPLVSASAATISTYKVIRAVAQVEPDGCFDGVNGWDVTRVSLGPYHFAFFIPDKTGTVTGESEFPAFLSFLAAWVPDDFQAAFGRYGINGAAAWPTDATPPSQNALYRSSRNWKTLLQQRGLQTAFGSVSVSPSNVTLASDADYFRTWHWFYRWVMACRLFPSFWPKSWDLCRYRIQVLLSTPFPLQVGPAGPAVGLPAGTTLGQVYTSEWAVTAVLRAHVNLPGSIIGAGQASVTVVTSFMNALASDNSLASDPATWTAAQHQSVDQCLVNLLKANYPAMATTLQTALNYASDAGPPVDSAPGSFILDPP